MVKNLYLWAKLGPNTWPEGYHPLLCHLVDVGAVTSVLWDKCLGPKTKEWVTRQLNAPDEESAKGFMSLWCSSHDFGKGTPAFQLGTNAKTGELENRLRTIGLKRNMGKPWAHGLLSVACLQEHFNQNSSAHESAWGEPNIRALSIAVGGHHGVLQHTDPEEAILQIGGEGWKITRQEMMRSLEEIFLPASRLFRLPNPLDSGLLVFLAGLTSVADWIGSNATFFPYRGDAAFLANELDIQEYAREAHKSAIQAVTALGWLTGRGGQQRNIRGFREVFPWIQEPRPLQRVAEKIAMAGADPGLVIVEAPMGEGKTEAAWYLAESWQDGGGQGTYVALPTMATSNQMFSRVLRFLEGRGESSNLMLQHGKSAFNELFESLRFEGQLFGDEGSPSGVVAEKWFSSNKLHGLLAPNGVGTIDQALLSVLQTRHFFVRLFGLAGKTVILDEVHAYDAYTSTILERMIRWLAVLNCRVVLLSATLPTPVKTRLLQAYNPGSESPQGVPVSYPRATWTCGNSGLIVQEAFHADPARRRQLKLSWLANDDLAALLGNELATGGCAAVIRNTVGTAQETYLNLKERLESQGIRVMLFHARYPFGRRSEIEGQVLGLFGKGPDGEVPNTGRPFKAVLVATQVIEQSLDIDFDLMVSDLAPVDLVLQRAGRLWRHDGNPRYEGHLNPRLILILPEIGPDGGPSFGLSEMIYARSLLLRSFLVLENRLDLAIPDEIDLLVETVYCSSPKGFGTNCDTVQVADGILDEEIASCRHKAATLLVKPPENEAAIEEMVLQLEEDNPKSPERLRAATRDTLPSVQIILSYFKDNTDFVDSEFCYQVDLARRPGMGEVRRLLGNEVSLSRQSVVRHALRVGRHEPWTETGALRHHHLVRIGVDGRTIDPGYGFRVDKELGIVFDQAEEVGS